MIGTNWRMYLLVGLLMVPVTRVAGGQDATHVNPHGETLATASSGNLKVSVWIYTHETLPPRKTEDDPYDQRSSCTGTRTPCSVVDSIQIKVNGKRVFVWRSVWCDLADLNTAKISIGRGKSTLTMTGGDGAEGYVVKVIFDKESVTRKTMASGMTPDEPFEDTTYSRGEPVG